MMNYMTGSCCGTLSKDWLRPQRLSISRWRSAEKSPAMRDSSPESCAPGSRKSARTLGGSPLCAGPRSCVREASRVLLARWLTINGRFMRSALAKLLVFHSDVIVMDLDDRGAPELTSRALNVLA